MDRKVVIFLAGINPPVITAIFVFRGACTCDTSRMPPQEYEHITRVSQHEADNVAPASRVPYIAAIFIDWRFLLLEENYTMKSK